MKHIDELAELYALGALSDADTAMVEAHLAVCAACTARVGASEAVIASLVDASVRSGPAPAELGARIAQSASAVPQRPFIYPLLRPLIGLAAALVLALGFSLAHLAQQNTAMRAALEGDERAFSTITHSHFRHAEFSRASASAPAAKVLYARDGTWFFVVVDGAHSGLDVVAGVGGATHDYGLAGVHGHTTTLFAQDAHRATRIELREGSTVIGVAAPQY